MSGYPPGIEINCVNNVRAGFKDWARSDFLASNPRNAAYAEVQRRAGDFLLAVHRIANMGGGPALKIWAQTSLMQMTGPLAQVYQQPGLMSQALQAFGDFIIWCMKVSYEVLKGLLIGLCIGATVLAFGGPMGSVVAATLFVALVVFIVSEGQKPPGQQLFSLTVEQHQAVAADLTRALA